MRLMEELGSLVSLGLSERSYRNRCGLPVDDCKRVGVRLGADTTKSSTFFLWQRKVRTEGAASDLFWERARDETHNESRCFCNLRSTSICNDLKSEGIRPYFNTLVDEYDQWHVLDVEFGAKSA
jgi:hypothetical protein